MNKAREAEVKLGRGGVGGLSEYMVQNTGLSWKWQKLSLVNSSRGVMTFSLFFFLLLLRVYIRSKYSFLQLTWWVLKKVKRG